MTLAGPRVYYAMAQDGLFLQAAARVHPRFHTPAVAIVAQSLWTAVLVLAVSLSQLVSYTGFAVVLFSAVAVASLFVLRRRYPDAPRPFRAWGYPWAPAIFVLACCRDGGERNDPQRRDRARWRRGHSGGYSRVFLFKPR